MQEKIQDESTPWWTEIPGVSNQEVTNGKNIRKHSFGSITSSLLLVLSFVAIVGWTIWGVDPARPTTGQYQSVEYPASVEAVLSQCGNTFTFDPDSEHYGVFDPDEIIANAGLESTSVEVPDHPMIVPVYGYMTEWDEGKSLLDKNSYTDDDIPARSRILRSMWDGNVVIWHSVGISDEEKARIAMVTRSTPNVVSVEWIGGELPLGRKFAFSTWNVSQSCERWDNEVFEQFLTFVEENPRFAAPTDEPPNAVLDENGMLQKIEPAL